MWRIAHSSTDHRPLYNSFACGSDTCCCSTRWLAQSTHSRSCYLPMMTSVSKWSDTMPISSRRCRFVAVAYSSRSFCAVAESNSAISSSNLRSNMLLVLWLRPPCRGFRLSKTHQLTLLFSVMISLLSLTCSLVEVHTLYGVLEALSLLMRPCLHPIPHGRYVAIGVLPNQFFHVTSN